MKKKQAAPGQTRLARSRSDRKEMVNLTFDSETFDQLSSLAKEEGCSLPVLISKAASSFLDAKDGPEAPKPSTPPLAHYLAAGKREFAAYARKLAEVEQAADLDAGSLVEALLSGMPDDSPRELAGWITHGWRCSQSWDAMESALVPVFNRWG